MFDINFIRYDADHLQRIVVDYQDHRDDTVEETAKAFGLRVLTCNHAVADIFGVDGERQKFWLFWTFGEMRVPRAAGPSTETN